LKLSRRKKKVFSLSEKQGVKKTPGPGQAILAFASSIHNKQQGRPGTGPGTADKRKQGQGQGRKGREGKEGRKGRKEGGKGAVLPAARKGADL
jgi:hypothetical protein